ncbi:MAG TPA: lipopolysaccharide biosynthesis protein [Jatrophihabitantaceae bacterium]|nr:lipopolysaccharide biosynthesis protein [Jatrophihabitantaceae bacterium]
MTGATVEAGPAPAEIAAPPLVGRKVGTGALWSALNAGTLRVATFVVSLVAARLIAPHDFGVFVVAVTVFNIAMSFAELGLSSAIVREHERSREIAPTIFTLSLANASVLAGLMVIFAPTLAELLGSAEATAAIRVLALFVLLAGFSAVPAALMTRDFMQRQRFIIDAAFLVSSTASMIVLVLLGHPVMGLAVSRVAGQVVTVVMITWMAPEHYWPGFHWRVAKPLLAFGLPLAASNLLMMVIANVDFAVVGHALGPRQLGYYNLAFSIAGWPVTIFSAVLISVTLPTLSRVRHSPRELTRHLAAGLSAVTALSFPVCALCSVLAGPLIDTVYGHRWYPAWAALVVLSIFGAARTVLTLFSDLTIALGLTRWLFAIQVAWLAVLVPVMVVCVQRWGITGAGVAHAAVVTLVVIPLYMIVTKRATPVRLSAVRDALLPPLGASLCAAGAAYAATLPVEAPPAKLLLGLVAGLLTYALVAGRWLLPLSRRLHDMYWRKDGERAAVQPAAAETTASARPSRAPGRHAYGAASFSVEELRRRHEATLALAFADAPTQRIWLSQVDTAEFRR